MIYIKTYNEPAFNIKEIQRYAGCKDGYENEINACFKELSGKLCYRVCYTELSVCEEPVKEWLSKSAALRKNLEGCEKIILFAATVGIEIDRLIAKYSRIAPSKALFFQAIGAERIEALCDEFNSNIKRDFAQKELYVRPRFSPGYGDFSLESQKEIFCILDCPRKIGLSLNESKIMSPSKSVTAIIGVSKIDKCDVSGCKICSKTDCEFRR